VFLCSLLRRPPPSTLLPYTTLFRSIAEIEAYAVGHGNLNQAPGINPGSLKAKGFTDEKITAINGATKAAFDIKFVFNQWTLGAEDRKSTRLNSSHVKISYAVFCLKK